MLVGQQLEYPFQVREEAVSRIPDVDAESSTATLLVQRATSDSERLLKVCLCLSEDRAKHHRLCRPKKIVLRVGLGETRGNDGVGRLFPNFGASARQRARERSTWGIEEKTSGRKPGDVRNGGGVG